MSGVAWALMLHDASMWPWRLPRGLDRDDGRNDVAVRRADDPDLRCGSGSAQSHSTIRKTGILSGARLMDAVG